MAQPCSYELNQSDGNNSVSQISNEAAEKSSGRLPEAQPLFKSVWWLFQMLGHFLVEIDSLGDVGSLLR